MKTIHKHYLSALIFVIFGVIAFACTIVKEPSQTQERGYSNKNKPVYKKGNNLERQ
jgi:hypothetical protein